MKSFALPLWLALSLTVSSSVTAATLVKPAPAPEYIPAGRVMGTVRLWGHGSYKHNFMGSLLHAWVGDFQKYQPHIQVENRLYGTASAIGALYNGAANLAILGEEISPAAAQAFMRARHYAPMAFPIATGSRDVLYFDYAHMIFVNRLNPIEELTVPQLEAIFGTEHRLSGGNIRRWGELGLAGEWASQAIQPYSWKTDEDFGLFFSEAVLGGSHRWNPAVKEFSTSVRPDGGSYDHGQKVLEALAKDRWGIALSNSRYAGPGVKALRLARTAAGPFYAPTRENLIAQKYPLTRIISAFIACPPGGAADPAVREFLRYILSRQGQAALSTASDYLPLDPSLIPGELKELTERSIVRIGGPARMQAVVRGLAEEFSRENPSTRIELNLQGSDTAMGALDCGQADIAFMGRECTPSEVQGFEWIYRYKPLRTAVMLGGSRGRGNSAALAVFVGRNNPLPRITLNQLERAFAAGASAFRTWGDLGLTGEWAQRPVTLYAPNMMSGTGRYFRHAALHDSVRLDWERLKEFPQGHAALEGLSRDPNGLAIASLDDVPGGVRAVELAATEAGPFLLPSPTSVADRSYPLTRTVVAMTNLPPGGSAAPGVAEFLRFIGSPPGQALVAQEGTYVPWRAP
jgi:phosphate transport system substrate-binding protein